MKKKIDLDIRIFRRYAREIRFDLVVENGRFGARTVDYSLIGVGVVMDDKDADIKEGDSFKLDIDELDLHETAKIVWIKKSPSALRAGILRSTPISGRLALYPLSDILIGLHRELKTGILKVISGETCRTAYIMNGQIVYGTSNHENDRLTRLLLKAGKINKSQYEEVERSGGKAGENATPVLVRLGYIKPSDVIDAVKLQTKRIVRSLFLMKDASFEFVEGPLPAKDMVTIKLSVSNFVFREVKKNADIALIEEYLIDSIIDFSSNPLDLFQDIRLTASEKELLCYVDGDRTIREIAGFQEDGRRIQTLRTIFGLLEARLLKVRGRDEPASGIRFDDVSREKVENISDLCSRIGELYQRYYDTNYYDVLELKRNATTEEIKRAYYRTAKKYHPDVHPRLPTDVKKKLVEIFTYVTNAYLTLSSRDLRHEYDNAVLKTREKKTDNASGVQSAAPVMQKEVNHKIYESTPHRESEKKAGNRDIAAIKFKEGRISFWDNKFNQAVRLFAAAIYFDSSVAEYHFFYGCALSMSGKFKEAVPPLNRANELMPQNAQIVAELGHVYLGLEFPLRAKGFFQKAIKLDPSNKRALAGMKLLKK